MRDYKNRSVHPFDRRLDDIIVSTNPNIHDGVMDMPHFESDETTLAEAVDWLNREAKAGELIGLGLEEGEDGSVRMLLGHPRRNATISAELTPDMKYKKIKLF